MLTLVLLCFANAAAPEEGGDEQQQQLDFPALAAAIASHPATDAEIKALCSDLQVLGRSEFKALLRWRLALRKDLKPLLGSAAEGEAAKQGSHKKQPQQQQQGEEAGEDDQQQDAEAKLLAEMEAVKDAAEQR
jgi:AdoMet-dependent rRNA methyltransferase SPB1